MVEEIQSGAQETRRSLLIDCALLLVLWIFMLACTMPYGNFPLNDDWNYARSVKALLDEHRLIVTHWSLAASLPHIILGWLVCSVAGFSFDALRAVSIIAGYISAVVLYYLCLRMNVARPYALLVGALLLTNPLFFNMATTFMTDVPFLMFAAFSFLYFSRMALTGVVTWSGSIFTSLVTILTCLTRQTGLVIPLGFLASVIAARNHSWTTVTKSALPAIVGAGAVYTFQLWLNRYVGELYSYRVEKAWLEQLIAKGPAYIVSNTMSNLICAFVYLGLFLLPILVISYPNLIRSLEGKARRMALIMFAEPLVLLAVGLSITRSIMPLGDNVLFNLGLGPVLLGGDGPTHYVTAPQWFWILVTIFGVIGASALVSTLFVVMSRSRNLLLSFLLWVFFLYLAVISFRGFFDRYLIFPLFILLPVVCTTAMTATSSPNIRAPRVLQPLAWLQIFAFAVFSIGGTHDYFAWNRARWQAAHDLVEVRNVSPMEIDGGLEFNGWYGYDPQYRDSGGVYPTPNMRHNIEYVMAMWELPGYDVVSRYSFERWLPWGGGEIIVQHRTH